MSTVFSRAPMRISFAGGGTDTDAFTSKYGGAVVSATIARYVRVKMEPGKSGYTSYPLAQSDVALLEKMASHFAPVSLEMRVDAPPRSGLGASGALGVATIGCLNTLRGKPLNRYEIAELAYKVESKEMGIAGGRQDQYAACFGGLNYIRFGSGVSVSRIEVKPETLLALENSLLLVFTRPRTGNSGDIMVDETRRVLTDNATTMKALMRQKELAHMMQRVLREGDLAAFGMLLNEAWQVKKRQTPITSNEFIDEVYATARRAGALGGKLSGAGGGGYLLLFAPGKEGPVAEAMLTMGLKAETVIFDFQGLKIW